MKIQNLKISNDDDNIHDDDDDYNDDDDDEDYDGSILENAP